MTSKIRNLVTLSRRPIRSDFAKNPFPILQFLTFFLILRQVKELFDRGIEEFNNGFFFEAHDTWEELWMDTRGSQRLFYQGLIQTAVGFYHFSNENYRGACSQFSKALSKLEQYLPAYHGVDTTRLTFALRRCNEQAEALRDGHEGHSTPFSIPLIELLEKRQDSSTIT